MRIHGRSGFSGRVIFFAVLFAFGAEKNANAVKGFLFPHEEGFEETCAIQWGEPDGSKKYITQCSATVIARDVILTAAHCAWAITGKAGSIALGQGNSYTATCGKNSVERWIWSGHLGDPTEKQKPYIIHPKWLANNKNFVNDYDLALIRIDPLPENYKIAKFTSSKELHEALDGECRISGFGQDNQDKIGALNSAPAPFSDHNCKRNMIEFSEEPSENPGIGFMGGMDSGGSLFCRKDRYSPWKLNGVAVGMATKKHSIQITAEIVKYNGAMDLEKKDLRQWIKSAMAELQSRPSVQTLLNAKKPKEIANIPL